jgi:hypothetical protein
VPKRNGRGVLDAPHEAGHDSGGTHAASFSRRDASEVCILSLQKAEGAGKAGCPPHPRPPVQQESTGVETTGVGGSSGLPCAMALRLIRDLPGDQALLSPSSVDRSTDLAPALGRQDHTTSPSASCHSSLDIPRPSHPAAYVRDDREAPLVSRKFGRMCERAVAHQPPVAGTEPATPQRRQSLDKSEGQLRWFFLNPNSCKGSEPEPSKEGSG